MDNVPPNPNRYKPIQGYLNSASATPEEFLETSLVYALETILMLHNGGEYARAQTDAMSAVRALRSQISCAHANIDVDVDGANKKRRPG
jgi:formiminotetrahydrofolate cyclodeaminase